MSAATSGHIDQTDQPRPRAAVIRRVGRWDGRARQRNAKHSHKLKIQRRHQEEQRQDTVDCGSTSGQLDNQYHRAQDRDERQCTRRGGQTEHVKACDDRGKRGHIGRNHINLWGLDHQSDPPHNGWIGFSDSRQIQLTPVAQRCQGSSRAAVCDSHPIDYGGRHGKKLLLA